MIPGVLTNFFVASAGAGAALLGLFFVSISISPEEKITADASVERRISAYSALTSLINAFFISLVALIPRNFGISVFICGLFSLFITVQNGTQLFRPHEGASTLLRRLILSILAMAVYIAQCYFAVQIIINPHDQDPLYALTTLLLIVYVVAIFRAWELLGGARSGLVHLLVSKNKPQSHSGVADENTTAAGK